MSTFSKLQKCKSGKTYIINFKVTEYTHGDSRCQVKNQSTDWPIAFGGSKTENNNVIFEFTCINENNVVNGYGHHASFHIKFKGLYIDRGYSVKNGFMIESSSEPHVEFEASTNILDKNGIDIIAGNDRIKMNWHSQLILARGPEMKNENSAIFTLNTITEK